MYRFRQLLYRSDFVRLDRINTISPGIVVTPLAYDEFNANGEGYQRMIDASAAQRTGTDLLIDGGVIASIGTGEYKLG